LPAPSSGVGIPNDWRIVYDAAGNAHAATLGGCNNCNIYQASTSNPASLAWTYTGGGAAINRALSANNADQPWIATGSGNMVAVAYDDFHFNSDERITVSSNNGSSFTVDSALSNGGQNTNGTNPGTRIATDAVGNIYSIFGVGSTTNSVTGIENVNYYINRSRDGGATWDYLGSSAIGGMQITGGNSTQLTNTASSSTWFAGGVNELRGNIDAIAASSDGQHVYAVFGHQDGSSVDRIYLEEFHVVADNLVASSPIVVSIVGQRSALPSVTVLADGEVVVMYDSYTTGDNKVHVHIADISSDGQTLNSDNDVYDFVPLPLGSLGLGPSPNREFGDYQYITSVGNNFYGAFVGVGNVNSGNVNTTGLVDPFFISGSASVPEPATIGLAGGLLVLGWFRRKRARG
jgi:hypothetical protein